MSFAGWLCRRNRRRQCSRLDMQLYADDVEALRRNVAKENRKDIALDAGQQQQSQALGHQAQQFPSMGMRI
jgi:hypothetical protein